MHLILFSSSEHDMFDRAQSAEPGIGLIVNVATSLLALEKEGLGELIRTVLARDRKFIRALPRLLIVARYI